MKLLNKIANSKCLLTISMVVLVTLFMFLTTGLSGVIPGWYGVVGIITNLIKYGIEYTANGYSALGEIVWFAFVIPVILVFKNKYVFTQKKVGFFKSLSLVWIDLVMCLAFLLLSVFSVGIKNIDMVEMGSMFVLFLFVGLFEELLCRGWILNEFLERFGNSRKNVIFSIITSAVIFGCIHIVNFFGGAPLFQTIIQIINAINGGIVFAALYYRTKNIWASVALHTIWDFTLSLATVNESVACASTAAPETTVITSIASAISIMFIIIPEVFNWSILLTKKDINDSLPDEYKEQLTEKQIKNSKTFKLVISILAGIYLFGFVAVFAFAGIFGHEEDTCANYPRVELDNYIEELSYSTQYLLQVEVPLYNNASDVDEGTITDTIPSSFDSMTNMVSLNLGVEAETETNCIGDTTGATNCLPMASSYTAFFAYSIKDGELTITNTQSEKSVKVDIKDVVRIYGMKKDGATQIFILALSDEGNGIVYQSTVMDGLESDADKLLESLKEFTHVELPSIVKIGSIKYPDADSDLLNESYPLFVAGNNYDYIMNDDGTISVYEK